MPTSPDSPDIGPCKRKLLIKPTNNGDPEAEQKQKKLENLQKNAKTVPTKKATKPAAKQPTPNPSIEVDHSMHSPPPNENDEDYPNMVISDDKPEQNDRCTKTPEMEPEKPQENAEAELSMIFTF